jgi:hypothetical protein
MMLPRVNGCGSVGSGGVDGGADDLDMKILRAVARHLGDLVARTVLFIAVAVVVGGALFWYFAVYDSASGRCDRGDLGACMVVQGR